MDIHQIAVPLLKEKKILQVDYFASDIVQTSRQNLQDWQHIHKPSKQQQKLWQYLQNEESHRNKYFRFKKKVNQTYFKKDLPQAYKDTIVSQALKERELFNTPTIQKLTSSMMASSVPIDQSVGDFWSNYQAWKQKSSNFQHKRLSSQMTRPSTQNHKQSKSVSRYWPLQQNFSTILEEDSQKSRPLKRTIETSIYKRSVGQGVKRSFQTMKARPMSQQLKRGTQKVKKIIQTSINPETNPKNIRHRLSTLTEQHTMNQKIVKTQRKSILDTINRHELISFLEQSKSIDPKRKGIFSLEDLTDFDKFNLSFAKYMRLKSLKRINKNAFENLVKQKHDNLEKFQNFILEEFPIQTDNKRKLQRIFQHITWEFKRVQRRKDAQKR